MQKIILFSCIAFILGGNVVAQRITVACTVTANRDTAENIRFHVTVTNNATKPLWINSELRCEEVRPGEDFYMHIQQDSSGIYIPYNRDRPWNVCPVVDVTRHPVQLKRGMSAAVVCSPGVWLYLEPGRYRGRVIFSLSQLNPRSKDIASNWVYFEVTGNKYRVLNR